nr:putative reverse transcriptase domain-containing protein [Tanacetum cinerariifolium]
MTRDLIRLRLSFNVSNRFQSRGDLLEDDIEILMKDVDERILTAQKEASDESAGLQRGLDEMIEHKSDGALYYLDRIWVPLKGDVRTLIMDEAHMSKYSIHPGADKIYYDLRDMYLLI